MSDDRYAIQALLTTYAERVDAGRFAEAAAMFEDATYRVERADGSEPSSCRGTAEVEEFMAGTLLYSDGTPRTKHVMTNVDIHLDGERASSRSSRSRPAATSTGSRSSAASGGSRNE